MGPPNRNLAIIFVLYRSYDEFDELLKSQHVIDPSVRLIVVDNTPHKDVKHNLLKQWSLQFGVQTYVSDPENLGYFGAGHYAAAIDPQLTEYNFVAISNTDVCLQAGEISQLLSSRYADSDASIGAIAPRLTGANGKSVPQMHYWARPSPQKYSRLAAITSNYHLGAAHRLAADIKRKYRRKAVMRPGGTTLFAPHGAFIIFTQKYMHDTMGFKSPSFLFNEEIFVGVELARAGLTCVFDPDVTYSHRGHGSMGTFPSRTLIQYLHDSHVATTNLLRQDR